MSIPITTTPSQGSPVFEPSTPTQTPLFGPNLTQDTSSTFNLNQVIQIPGGQTIILTDAPITIGQFSDAVGLSVNSSKQIISLGNLASLLANNKINVSQGDLANALAIIRENITQLQIRQDNLLKTQNNEINAVNQATTDLNTAVQGFSASDQSQIDTMNAAIQDYNAGNITAAQFNAVATAYNNYVATRNAALQPFLTAYSNAVTTYEQEINANNDTINQLNPELASYGIPTMDLQTNVPPDPPLAVILTSQSLAPLTIPVPTIAYPETIPLLDQIGPPILNPVDYLTNYYQPIAQELLTSLSLSNLIADIQNGYLDFLLFYLPGQRPAEPPSYFTQIPQVFLNNDSGGSGGVAVAALSPVFDSASINGALSNAILASDLKNFQRQFSQAPLNLLINFGAQVSVFGGLQAAITGLRLLGLNALTNSRAQTAFGIAFGLSNSQITAQEVNSGKIRDFVQQVVREELGKQANQTAINNATDFLTASLNLALLQSSLLNSSISLGTPGLVGQVLGNVSTFTPEAVQAPSSFNEVANDPLNRLFLKTILAEQLFQSQTVKNEAKAQQIVNDSINQTLLQGEIKNSENFKNILSQQLIAQGIAASIASSLSNLGSRLLEEEAKAQRILNENLLNQRKVQERLAAELTQQAQIDAPRAQAIANRAVNNAFQNSLISNTFEFQYALQNQLLAQGIKQEGAAKALTNVVGSLNLPVIGTPPLVNTQLSSVLPPIELANALHGFIQSQLGILDTEKARQIADQVVSTFIGTPNAAPLPGQIPSILSLINKNAETIQRLGGIHGVNQLAQRFRDYLSPNVDLLAFSRKILDPAYNLFFSASTGIMYAGEPIPSNFKHELDIRV